MSKENPRFLELLGKHGYLTASDMEPLFRAEFGGQVAPDFVNDLWIEPLIWAQRILETRPWLCARLRTLATARALGRLTRCAQQWPRWLIEFGLDLIDSELHELCGSPDDFSPAASVITARFEGRISGVEFQILMRALGYFRAEMERLDDRLKEWPYEEAHRCARRLMDKNRPCSLLGPFDWWPKYDCERNHESFLSFYQYLSLKPRPAISFVTVEPESEGDFLNYALRGAPGCT